LLLAVDRPLLARTKLLWSSSALGVEALTQSRNAWLIFFYAPPADADRQALLSLGLVSLLLFAGKFLEAFDDTLIGYWSDRTSSRLGRRIPFILAGTPLMAIFAVLMFMPPQDAGTAMTALYFFLTLELFFLFSTLAGAPYEALLPEIARTSAERVSLSAWRVTFGVAGAGLGLIGSGLLISVAGFKAMAIVMAMLALTGRLVGVGAVWKRVSRDTPPVQLPLRVALRSTFTNRAFLAFMPSFVLFGTSMAMLIGLLPFYVNGVLQRSDTGVWVAILTATGIGAMTAAIPFFVRLSSRTSKQHAYRAAMLVAAGAFPLLFVAGFIPGIPVLAQVLVVLALVGAPMAAVFVFPGPMVADICDDDALRTGMRREGSFYGSLAFCEKLAGSFAPLLLGVILLLGNTAANPLGIRLVGPAAGLIVLAGYLSFRSYRLESPALISVSPFPAGDGGRG
jgi:glycoside/pentoside/hexuronide:cation symporter, GPH family